MRVPVGSVYKDVVFLGEAHLSSRAQRLAGERILPYFDAIGYEGAVDFPCQATAQEARERRLAVSSGKDCCSCCCNNSVISLAWSMQAMQDTRNKPQRFVWLEPKHGYDCKAIFSYLLLAASAVLTVIFVVAKENEISQQNKYIGYGVAFAVGVIACVFDYSSTKDREFRMRNTIIDALKEPWINKMVVIVGRLHVGPLCKGLMADYDATEGNFANSDLSLAN